MMEQKKGEQVELRQQSPPALTQVHLPANLRSSEPAGRRAGSGSSAQEAAYSHLNSAALEL